MRFLKKKEERAQEISFEDALLQAILGKTEITKATAMQIPTISSAIGLIGNIIASTPIKLYKLDDGKAVEILDDSRIALLNDDTGDTLNAHDFWRAIVRDYYLGKGAYAYINKSKGKYKSVHYVDEEKITIRKNNDPIFKDYDILVNGLIYKPYDFIKILRNSKDGANGTGIITENSLILAVAYQTLVFEETLVKKGGNKKGFLKANKRLDEPAMNRLREAYKNLYSNNNENVVILNNGIEFQESSNTSVEMQLNENKKTNSEEMCKIFNISPNVITGTANDTEMSNLPKLAAVPLMSTIQCALNRDFLLEKEKGLFYWAFDTKELLKGNLKDRIEAWGMAIKNKMMTPNEARFQEDWPNLPGLDIINMGLGDVIYDVKTQKFYTPNTQTIVKTKEVKNN